MGVTQVGNLSLDAADRQTGWRGGEEEGGKRTRQCLTVCVVRLEARGMETGRGRGGNIRVMHDSYSLHK